MKRNAGKISKLAVITALFAQGAVAHDAVLHAHTDIAQGDGRVPAFYSWSRPVPGHEGRMVAMEALESSLSLSQAGSAYRILYTSKDGVDGEDIVAVSGAVFLPKGKAPDGGWPVIAWAHGTVGMADVCAPSLAGRSARDSAYLNAWLKEGYAIVATDYQGLGTPGPHPYVNARPQAYSVLDSIRAAQRGFPVLSPKTVIVGQSQGGQAAVAAAAYAPTYAPELDIRGTVATGTPYKFSQSLQVVGQVSGKVDPKAAKAADPTIYYMFYGLLMAQQTQPDLKVADIVTPEALPLFEQAKSVCNTRLEADIRGAMLTRDMTFKTEAYNAAMTPVLAKLEYPGLKFKSPLFLGIGGKDAEVPSSAQLALAKDACAEGSVVVTKLYPELSHSGAVNGSLPDSLPFVKSAFEGKPIAPQCPK
ncbi:alpha/beta hydrolase [Asticcacaulis endophyticus]|uniref:Lipase n=1 Tax=Asticcacaulis endophyticus TaxID=1395890 RepID=A0A918Q9A1_9CAUL|nr:alpha/beta fold hydrolase [Asticcacaulis endophyticus]GGZ35339.1 lipase [Asticcacaulis endophyticus]